MPGGSGTGSGSGGLGEGEGEPADPSWEIPEASSGAGGDDGWQTSNELPGGSSGSGGEEGEGEGTGPGGSGNGGELTDGATGSGGTGGSDDELEGALEDLDGEILAEREIIRSSASGGSGNIEIPIEEAGGAGSGGDAQLGGSLPSPRPVPQAPAPPRRGAEGVPDDIPDARDDDIIARQLREAAMHEQDPELKEKLWEEYRKYKKG